MLDYDNKSGEVCVIGRCNYDSGIGQHTYAFAELFSRFYPTCIQPTEPHLREQDHIELPNGRRIPVWSGQVPYASIFLDVLWNGVDDSNYLLVPQQGLRLACLVWDSDVLPTEWVDILNSRFDGAVALSPHLIETARRSGVHIPCVSVPLALAIEPLLSKPFKKPRPKIRFGSVAAFHPRKNTRLLVEAFAEVFGNRNDVELIIHSNLAFGDVIEDTRRFLYELSINNVRLSTDNLSIDEKNDLIEGFDVFVNLSKGEGYSIGPREALALGKVLVISDTGGHRDLRGIPGVFSVKPDLSLPARFPEIDNRVIGNQESVTPEAACEGLQRAYRYMRSGEFSETVFERRQAASQFSFTRVAPLVGRLLDPGLAEFKVPARNSRELPGTALNDPYRSTVSKRIASVPSRNRTTRRVIPMHDGGFYSIFNAFFSNLVWDLMDDRCHATLPDWDVGRFLRRQGDAEIQSFCYGQVTDGNIWTKFFEPLYGATDSAMQSEDFLYREAAPPDFRHNEYREPLLTYIHAARLYREPWFGELRRQYNQVYRHHIHLKPVLQAEIDQFHCAEMAGYTVLGAHVRHPSHTVEQPGAVIAHADQYIERLNQLAARRRLSQRADNWRVFLATDQERVIARFREQFGDRLVYWPQARRTTLDEDALFDQLPEEEKNADGFQLQHIVASNQANWSIDMGIEVIRDANLMAKCDALLHVVSNVSTAVSFINPDCEMIYTT